MKGYVAAPVELATADSELTRLCDDPAPAPGGGKRYLSQRETEALLATNTAALIICRDRHTGLVQFMDRRDKGITGQ